MTPQPTACVECGRPFTRPLCAHTRMVLAALVTDPRELADGRRYCPTRRYHVRKHR